MRVSEGIEGPEWWGSRYKNIHKKDAQLLETAVSNASIYTSIYLAIFSFYRSPSNTHYIWIISGYGIWPQFQVSFGPSCPAGLAASSPLRTMLVRPELRPKASMWELLWNPGGSCVSKGSFKGDIDMDVDFAVSKYTYTYMFVSCSRGEYFSSWERVIRALPFGVYIKGSMFALHRYFYPLGGCVRFLP